MQLIGLFSQIGLIVTALASIAIVFFTCRSQIYSTLLGRIWVAFNIVVAIWAFIWWTGAFYWNTDEARWISLYISTLVAIAIPPLFLVFVRALTNKQNTSSVFVKIAIILSGALFISSLMFPRSFVFGIQKLGVAYIPSAGFLLWIFAFQYLILVSWATWLLFVEIKSLHGAQRNKILYVFVACGIGSLGAFTTFPSALGIIKSYPNGVILVPIYSIGITYAILRHRLMDITVIIRKTLVYSAVMGALTIVYLGVVTLFAKVFQGLTGYQTIFSSAIAASLVTLGFQPLRKRVQAFVDTKFFRQYVDREEKLYELSREVITHTTPEAMAEALMRVLGETLHPKAGGVYLRARDGGGFRQISHWGDVTVPERMEDDNPLAIYFVDHPQPFVQDLPSELGVSQGTREPENRSQAA